MNPYLWRFHFLRQVLELGHPSLPVLQFVLRASVVCLLPQLLHLDQDRFLKEGDDGYFCYRRGIIGIRRLDEETMFSFELHLRDTYEILGIDKTRATQINIHTHTQTKLHTNKHIYK